MERNLNNVAETTPRPAGIPFGLIGALVSVACFLILNVAGMDMTGSLWAFLYLLVQAIAVALFIA